MMIQRYFKPYWPLAWSAAVLLLIVAKPGQAATFESGSTCGTAFYNSSTCRQAFNPPANITVQLPPDGVLDYTTVNVPYGVTVTFARNAANTPVIIRASGDVTIAGAINVGAAKPPTNSGTYGDGNLGDDGQPGIGGPGGFDGGFGGYSPLFGGVAGMAGGGGKGPGGGGPGSGLNNDGTTGAGGGGASFGGYGGNGGCWYGTAVCGPRGSLYGQAILLPLIGGSGGGGGSAGVSYNGAGGGGGGGAILIAAGTATNAATITVGTTANSSGGRIYADGGTGGYSAGTGAGGGGGGGSGGAIRLVAETLACPNGWCYMEANGSGGGSGPQGGGAGGSGIIRLEANNITGWNTGRTSPAYTFSLPSHVLVPNNPTLAIISVTPTSGPSSGITANVPSVPTGNADITFPADTTTATVTLQATGIPPGSTADVYVIPSSGAARTMGSNVTALSLPDANGISTATANVTLSPGNNVLQAAVTYTVTEQMLITMHLPKFNGEYVAKIRVEGGMNGESKVTYITASGKEYPAVGKAKA